MSQDIVSDVLNQIMNAKRAKKEVVVTTRVSKLLLNVLELMKQLGYIDYKLERGELKITLKEITECKAIKPRYGVNKEGIEKYVRRFLPSRNFGQLIISTNNGLMTHSQAQEKKMGGSLIAYFY